MRLRKKCSQKTGFKKKNNQKTLTDKKKQPQSMLRRNKLDIFKENKVSVTEAEWKRGE